ncbi:hypothetical protein FRC00_009945 [Tulasnella sp. 408]|nr:hypothetical protein FRC00_009945 [Tulasnella sp. 408]
MTDVPSNDSTHRSTLDPVPVYDLQHHIASKPLERQYAELVAIHFGSFALARGPLMSKTTAKKFVKYLWSITLGLLPYDGPADPPPITAHDITYAISYAKSLIKCGKAVARLLAVTHFDPLTRTYPDDDTSFLFSNRDVDPVKDNISLRFALDEFSTGSYLKLSFTEWAQEYSWGHVERLWDSAKELQGGAYLDGVQRSLAEQLR